MAMLGDEKYNAAQRAKKVDFTDSALANYRSTIAQNDAAAKSTSQKQLSLALKGYNSATNAQGLTPVADTMKSGYHSLTGGPPPVATTSAAGSTPASVAAANAKAQALRASGQVGATTAANTAAAANTANTANAAANTANTGAASSGPIGWLIAAISANETGAMKASQKHGGYSTNAAGEREAATEQGRRSATDSGEWFRDALTGKGFQEDMEYYADDVDKKGPLGEMIRGIGRNSNPEGFIEHRKDRLKDPKKFIDPIGLFS